MKYLFLLCFLTLHVKFTEAQNAIGPAIGIVQNIENDSLLQRYGYRYLVESVGKLISPRTVTDEQFQSNVLKIKNLRVPMYAFNIFIPGELKIVGPDVNEAALLTYVDKVFQRCQAAGVNRIIWGSGGCAAYRKDLTGPRRKNSSFLWLKKSPTRQVVTTLRSPLKI